MMSRQRIYSEDQKKLIAIIKSEMDLESKAKLEKKSKIELFGDKFLSSEKLANKYNKFCNKRDVFTTKRINLLKNMEKSEVEKVYTDLSFS